MGKVHAMTSFKRTARMLLRDEAGISIVECGVLVALLSTIIVFAATGLQVQITDLYGRIVAVF